MLVHAASGTLQVPSGPAWLLSAFACHNELTTHLSMLAGFILSTHVVQHPNAYITNVSSSSAGLAIYVIVIKIVSTQWVGLSTMWERIISSGQVLPSRKFQHEVYDP